MLYYSLKVSDSFLKQEIEKSPVSFDTRRTLYRNLAVGDGSVTVDLTTISTAKALYISSTGPITTTINGADIAVKKSLFVELTSLTSLAVSCAESEGYDVVVVVWGDA